MLDGAQSAEEIAKVVKAQGQSSVAITDHGSLYGAYKFYNACRAEDIKPIIGSELYCAPSQFAKSERATEDGFSGRGSYSHLTVLAATPIGLRNLYKLTSESFSQGFYYKPRTDLESLGAHREGLIVGSGCLSGELATRIKLEQPDLQDSYIDKLKGIFGDSFYIEVMNHGFELETLVLNRLLELADRHKVRLLGTNDSHYALREASVLHDAMLCLSTRTKLDDPKRMRFEGSGYYLKNRGEMEDILPREALDSTLEVAERVTDYGDMFTKVIRMPKAAWQYSEDHSGDGYTSHKELEYIAWGELEKYCDPRDKFRNAKEYSDRLRYELDVISRLGFSDYFLVLAHILRTGKQRGIRPGPGRGSAGGSLVSFVLGIIALDPIELNLSFERFLNAERVSLPDIDIDIPDDRRDELIQIAIELYGSPNTAKMGTINTIGARAALKDSSRVLGLPYTTGEQLTWCLPKAQFGRNPSLADIDLVQAAAIPSYSEVIELAKPLEGLARAASQHAAGIVISPIPLVDILPTWNAKVAGQTKMSDPITQWDMHAIEDLGLVKYDFLGLNTLGTIESVLSELSSRKDNPVSLEVGFHLSDVTDRKTFSLLSTGHSIGIFQLDSPGMQRLLRKLAPQSIHDIAAVLALNRPGPMGVNAHWDFAERKNNRKQVQFPHEEFRTRLAGILGPTYGLIVYQEQVTAILVEICGYTTNEADSVRKAMGKKDRALLAQEERRVLSTPGFTTEALQTLWDTLVPFADYAFNKSHAYGYAFVSYWTAYLKANYPKEWFAALLTTEEKPEKVKEYMDEVRRLGIAIMPPDVNTSGVEWTSTVEGIRYGLATIKGVGPKVIKALQVVRPFGSWGDFLRRGPSEVVRLNVATALLYAGALDTFGSREGIAATLQNHLDEAKQEREERSKGELGLRTRSFAIPQSPADFRWRKAREKEVLGLSISERPTLVILPSDLGDADWDYVRSAVAANPGMSQLFIAVGSWKLPYGTVDSEGILRSLEPLGGKGSAEPI